MFLVVWDPWKHLSPSPSSYCFLLYCLPSELRDPRIPGLCSYRTFANNWNPLFCSPFVCLRSPISLTIGKFPTLTLGSALSMTNLIPRSSGKGETHFHRLFPYHHWPPTHFWPTKPRVTDAWMELLGKVFISNTRNLHKRRNTKIASLFLLEQSWTRPFDGADKVVLCPEKSSMKKGDVSRCRKCKVLSDSPDLLIFLPFPLTGCFPYPLLIRLTS